MAAKVDFEFFRGETYTLTVAHGQSETPSVAMIGFRYPSSDAGPLYLSKSSEWSPDDFSIDATNVTITINPSDTETIHALPYYYSITVRLADGTQKVIQYGIASIKGSAIGDVFDIPPNFLYVGVTRLQKRALDAASIVDGDIIATHDWVTPGNIGAASETDFSNHKNDTGNPHSVTPAQIGAATQSAMNAHEANTNNPHQVTTAQIGAAMQSALDAHEADTNNPHHVTYTQTGAAPANHDLGSHSDVDTTGASDGSVLGFDISLSKWVPQTASGPQPTYISGTGTCVRFPSGLQICWVYPIYVVNGTSATWTYPAAFSSSPTVVVSGYRSLMNLYSDPPGTTAVAVYNTSSIARNAGIIAVGEWT